MKCRTVVLASMLFLISSLATLAVAQSAAVSQVRGPIWISVPTSAAPLQSIKVKAPAAGNVIVTVTGSINYEHTLGTEGVYCLALSETSGNIGGCIPDSGSDSAVRGYIAAAAPSTVPGFGALEQYSIVRVYPVSANDTYTFYLNGYQTGFGLTDLFQPSITALYVAGTLAQ
jgi:hypothetical protein